MATVKAVAFGAMDGKLRYVSGSYAPGSMWRV
jgi:hypothetical protein